MATSIPAVAPPLPADRRRALHAELARYPASTFTFDPRLAEGWLSDRYFQRTAATLAHAGRSPRVTMQLFAKQHGIVAGVYEAIRLLQTQLAAPSPDGRHYSLREFEIETLLEGDAI